MREFDAIEQNITSHREEVIDARGPAEFNKPDPENGQLNNNIPNSKNVPYNELFDEATGAMKDKQALLERI